MLVRSDKFRASKIMAERVQKTENIEILMNWIFRSDWSQTKY